MHKTFFFEVACDKWKEKEIATKGEHLSLHRWNWKKKTVERGKEGQEKLNSWKGKGSKAYKRKNKEYIWNLKWKLNSIQILHK